MSKKLETFLIGEDKLEVGVDESGKGCEFEDALVLTKNGWKHFTDIDKKNDLVLSYTDEHTMVWQKINKIISYPVKEELVQLKHRSMNILVTNNHEFDVLVRKMEKGKVIGYTMKKRKVNELRNNDYIPRIGEWIGEVKEFFTLPSIPNSSSLTYTEITIKMDLWLAFIGIFLSEGNTSFTGRGNYITCITQTKHGPRDKIIKLLDELPFNFNTKIKIDNKSFVCHNKQLYTYLLQFGKCYDKHLPDDIKNLSKRQLNILLDWLLLGDGNVFEHIAGNRQPYITYYTSSIQLKNDVEELSLKCGYGFSTKVKTEKGSSSIIVENNKPRTITATVDNYQILLTKTEKSAVKTLVKNLVKTLVYKEGNVFCLNLPTYHNFYVKRDGRGYFTGNSAIGRVYAAAVYWDPSVTSELIRDSKKLNHRKRLIAYDFIKEHCLSYGFAYCEADEIDKNGISPSNMKCMHNAINNCYILPEHVLVDGNYFKLYMDRNGNAVNHTTIIGGDDKYYSIAAAGIVAKVERDLYIEKLCDDYPDLNLYDIKSNKGYMGAKKHIDAIKHWGITPYHRKTYGICKNYA